MCVLIGGCHSGDCHCQNGNYQTLKWVNLLKKMMTDLNINENRLPLEWIPAAETEGGFGIPDGVDFLTVEIEDNQTFREGFSTRIDLLKEDIVENIRMRI